MMKFLQKSYMFIIFALLYAPIVVLIVFSFNDGGSLSEFTGISLKWYGELFRDEEALTALKNSLILAVSSSVIATIIATFAALGLHHMKNKLIKGTITSITNVPMMNPDIVTGVSMMLLFVAVANFIHSDVRMATLSAIISFLKKPHSISCIPNVKFSYENLCPS